MEEMNIFAELQIMTGKNSVDEISSALGIPVGTVVNLRNGRAGKSLKKAYSLAIEFSKYVPVTISKQILSNMR